MSKRPRIILGTLAKACLEPGSMGVIPLTMNSVFIRSKPKKVLFTTRGELAMVEPDLIKMGIMDCDVAER